MRNDTTIPLFVLRYEWFWASTLAIGVSSGIVSPFHHAPVRGVALFNLSFAAKVLPAKQIVGLVFPEVGETFLHYTLGVKALRCSTVLAIKRVPHAGGKVLPMRLINDSCFLS